MKIILSLLFLVLAGCTTAEITDFEACPVELPYSGDGYCKRVVSQKSRRIPKEKWVVERRTMVCLPHDSYKQLKIDLYKQCYNNQCKQALDSVGDLFQTLDEAAQQLIKDQLKKGTK